MIDPNLNLNEVNKAACDVVTEAMVKLTADAMTLHKNGYHKHSALLSNLRLRLESARNDFAIEFDEAIE